MIKIKNNESKNKDNISLIEYEKGYSNYTNCDDLIKYEKGYSNYTNCDDLIKYERGWS